MKKRNKYEIINFIHQGKPTLKQINPEIENLTIKLDYSKSIEYSGKSVTLNLKPNDSSVVTPECINRTCTKGFFDLTNIIYFLLRDKKEKISGELNCDGKQDLKHTDYNCHVKLCYEIIPTYKK
jgi:hypothetical protein